MAVPPAGASGPPADDISGSAARVAVVGTGRMGGAMVGRLRGAELPVVVYNRTRAKAEAVAAEHGADVAGTAREAVGGADVVIVSLPDDEAAFAAYRGPDGLVAGLSKGAVVADTSTVAPATVRELAGDVAGAGAALLDSPVSGSVATVEAGALTVMVGGDEAALEKARPALDAFAKQVVHLGPIGAGAVMKLVVNSIVHALNVALSEALVVAERAGVDRQAAYDVIAAGAVGAPFVQYKRDSFLDPEGTAVAFALDLVAKDLDLALALADEVGAKASQLATNRAVVGEAIAAGYGSADLSAVAQHLRAD
ncbi:MAG TPA: NAD(P)-dependent oxidoreductase [Jiangellaceae bacterium]